MKNQKQLSNQILELLSFTNQWQVVDNNDTLKLITTGMHSLAVIKGEVNYVDVDNDKPVDQWEMFKLKYNPAKKLQLNRRLNKILSK